MRGNTGIGDIIVKKDQLLDVLRANRETHADTYRRACEAFEQRALDGLSKLMDQIRTGRKPRYLSVPIPVPEEHTADYDRAIQMLEMHTGDHVTLTEVAYQRLVDDQWEWSGSFASNSTSYLQHDEGDDD